MPVSIACPNCATTLKAPDEVIGKTVKCPKCQESFTAQVGEQPAGVVLEEVPPQSAAQAPATAAAPQPQYAAPSQPAPVQTPVLTMPARQCVQCGFQGYMAKKWESWVVPVAIVVAIFTAGLGLLFLLTPKKHCCPQCSALFE